MNKMVVNRLGKLFVTNDAATIIKEIEVIHPAAKLVVLASEQQQMEVQHFPIKFYHRLIVFLQHGDHTNLVIVFAGELLAQAETLLRMGLHTSDVIRGFEKANALVHDLLDKMVSSTVKIEEDAEIPRDAVTSGIMATLGSKLHGYEDLFAKLVVDACVQVLLY